MHSVLLDTDILINLLKKNETTIASFLKLHTQGTRFFYNPIVTAEVYAGAFEKELKAIGTFFNTLEHVDISDETGREAGIYANTFRKAYHKISLEDYLIAACAKVNHLTLWTNNKKHYPMKDIKII